MKEMFHALLILGLIIPLIIAVLYGLKYVLTRPFSLKTDKAIRMTHQLAIGSKERLLCVEVDGVRLLLGITPHSISTLHVFDANSPNTVSPKELA